MKNKLLALKKMENSFLYLLWHIICNFYYSVLNLLFVFYFEIVPLIELTLCKLYHDKYISSLQQLFTLRNLSAIKFRFQNEIQTKTQLWQNFDISDALQITEGYCKLVLLFNAFVRGSHYNITNRTHCGSEGHWLENILGNKPNSRCEADIYGYEIKKQSQKMTFGDWSATYLFSPEPKTEVLRKINKRKINMSREEFIQLFGNQTADNRISWSGCCVPKYGEWNESGQKLVIDKKKNILALYSYKQDKRANKQTKILKPEKWKKAYICIAIWEKEAVEKKINDKFNQKGFFICTRNQNETYDKILFGEPLNFNFFIQGIKNKQIYFDSGMYHDTLKKNTRNYSMWRANGNFWLNLVK